MQLSKVHVMIKRALEELHDYYKSKNITTDDINLWKDLNRLKNLYPTFDNGYTRVSDNSSNSNQITTQVGLEDSISGIRYVSESELARLFGGTWIKQDLPELLNLPDKTIVPYNCKG